MISSRPSQCIPPISADPHPLCAVSLQEDDDGKIHLKNLSASIARSEEEARPGVGRPGVGMGWDGAGWDGMGWDEVKEGKEGKDEIG